MNKKLIAIFVSLSFVALLAIPVMANPTNGPNKVAVTVDMTRNDGPGPGTPLSPNRNTGPIIHLYRLQNFDGTFPYSLLPAYNPVLA